MYSTGQEMPGEADWAPLWRPWPPSLASYFRKYGKLPSVLDFVDGILSAAICTITGFVVVIAKDSTIAIKF